MKTLIVGILLSAILIGCGGGSDPEPIERECLVINSHGQFDWGPCPDNSAWRAQP